MIFSIPQLIEHVSSIMTLEVRTAIAWLQAIDKADQEGDLILTGTPEGVGPIEAGDHITAGIQRPEATDSLVTLELDVVDRAGGFSFESSPGH
jgi:acylpyruvate hydrolase